MCKHCDNLAERLTALAQTKNPLEIILITEKIMRGADIIEGAAKMAYLKVTEHNYEKALDMLLRGAIIASDVQLLLDGKTGMSDRSTARAKSFEAVRDALVKLEAESAMAEAEHENKEAHRG